MSNLRLGKIYYHYNKITNKYYVGSTVQTKPELRWRKWDKSYSGYKDCTKFINALRKYTWDVFESLVLEENIPLDQISFREEFYINKYNSYIDGYNSLNISNGYHVPHNKKFYIYKNNIPLKHCYMCNTYKMLEDFGQNSNTWDEKMRQCKSCWSNFNKEHKVNRKLSEADLKKSYIERTAKMRESVINNYQNNPETKQKLSKAKAKPIKAVHSKTGEILKFESALKAKEKGFNNTNLGQAIKNKTLYKDYYWFFDEKIQEVKEIEPTPINIEQTKQEIINSRKNINKIRIHARDCVIKDISSKEEKEFLDRCHLQGSIYGAVKYGLFYNDKLVALMNFGKPRYNKNYEWEIYRFCSELNTQVYGGANKLLTHFKRTINPNNILTYANKAYSNGDLYKTLGFTKLEETYGSYSYFKNGVRYSRQKCQKHKLKDLLEVFNPELSERRNMEANGFVRVEEPGNYLFVWKK